ncbi:MAG: PH domain-containing protein [Flavobacteriaceae bacterium]
MKRIYKSSVSKWTYLMFFLIVIIMIAPLFTEDWTAEDLREKEFFIYIGVTVLTIGLFLWILFGTYYKIENDYLHHRSGPLFGKMKISSIKKIKYHSGWYVPVLYRPSTDIVGVIITYNKFDDIYFSPQQRDEFVRDLLKINPEIEVID